MRLIYGTNNTAKFSAMQRALSPLPIELIFPRELGLPLPSITEAGDTPLQNARIKANAYYREWGNPVFSCDSALYAANLPDELQIGLYIRRVNGRDLTDDEMVEHYSSLARRFGPLKCRYRNAVCLISDHAHRFESEADDLDGDSFLLVDTPHKKRVAGFPLDCLSVDIETGRYYYDIDNYMAEALPAPSGFLRFFGAALKEMTGSCDV